MLSFSISPGIPFIIGNVYISDSTYHCIRKVTVSTGIITTVAGTIDSSGYSGDNGLATFATLHEPSGIAVDSSGNAPAFYSLNGLMFTILLL